MASAAPAAPGTRGRRLVRSTLAVAGLRGLDFGLSFLVSVLLAGKFGAGAQLDAFFLARRTTVGFADMIRKLVVQVVMPSVVAQIDGGRRLSIHGLPGRLYVFVAIFAVITLTGTLIPGILVSLFAPGFTGARHDLTATMMAIMMPLLPLSVVGSLLVAVLQANRRYWLSEGTNLVQRAMLVAVLAVAVPPLGIVAGAWTMLVAGVIGTAILLAGAWSIVRHHPEAMLRREAKPVADTGPGGGVAAAILLNVYLLGTSLIDFAAASLVAEGGVAALEYGARLVSLVPGLVMSSLYTVMLPELIRTMQAKERDPQALARYQRMVIFAQAPVTIGMMLGAELMVQILFGRGAFGAQSIALAAGTTVGYAAAQLFLAPMSALTSAIYSDPRKPCLRDIAVIAAAGTALRVAAVAIGAALGGAPGIAWGATAATLGAALVTQAVARHRFDDLRDRGFAGDLARIAACAGAAALAGWALLEAVPAPTTMLARLALLAALGIVVIAGFAASAFVLRVPEVARLRRLIAALVDKRRARG